MPVRFHLFYFAQDTGQYLESVLLAFPQGEVVEVKQLPSDLAADTPMVAAAGPMDIVVLEYQHGLSGLDHWIETLQHQSEPPAIFLYMEQADTHTLLKALRLGVQECFIGHIKEEEFAQAIGRLQRLRQRLKEGETTQIIGLLGCKGGVGVTFLAVNLAQALATEAAAPVLLMDLDLNNSDIGSFLDVPPRYSLLDVIEKYDSLDAQYWRDVVHRRDSGLEVLQGPLRLEDRELVRAGVVQSILAFLRGQFLYRHILLDLGNTLDEVTMKALEETDLLLLVIQLTVPALRDAKKLLEILLLLEFPEEKIKLVANGYSPAAAIAPKEAEKYLGQELLLTLRFEHDAVIRSLNEGQPLVELWPRHRLSSEIQELAKLVAPAHQDHALRPGRWATLKRFLKWGR